MKEIFADALARMEGCTILAAQYDLAANTIHIAYADRLDAPLFVQEISLQPVDGSMVLRRDVTEYGQEITRRKEKSATAADYLVTVSIGGYTATGYEGHFEEMPVRAYSAEDAAYQVRVRMEREMDGRDAMYRIEEVRAKE